jgi:hypothetical protein
MSQTVADVLVGLLERIGVEHVFGLIGDSLNAVAGAIRRSHIKWIGVRHEKGAALAAAELEPEVQLVRVDGDAAPELLQRFSIQSIPTLMLVHRDRELARRAGVMPLPQLLAWTREYMEGVKA